MNRNWLEDLEFAEPIPPTPEVVEEVVQERTFNTEDIHNAARESMDFLAAMCMPTIFRYFFPKVFQGIWNWLLSYVNRARDFSQLAIGLPRGFGKTMVIKIFIIYCILFTKKSFILIICGTQTKANNIISDIMMMLDEPNIKKVFGHWRTGEINDRQDLKRFGFRGRNIILAGAGAGSDIRGITLNNERPDIMVFDDIQTREEADSKEVSDKIETWMIGTAMKAKNPFGCLFIFIANMYPTPHSLLKKLKRNPMWVKFIVGGILADGTSLWEDLQPIKQLMAEYANDAAAGKAEIFHAEVLNDEDATVNHLVDMSKIPTYPFSEDEISEGKFIIIDPATDKANADAVSIGFFDIHDNKPVCKEIEEGRFSPGETISRTLTMAIRRNCRFIAVEANAYQHTLLYWFNYISLQYQIEGIQFEPVYSGIKAKNSRILTMFRSLMAGEIYYHPATAIQVNSQITAFMPSKKENIDGVLDLLTYAPKVIELYGATISSMATLEDMNITSIGVASTMETSPF